MRLITDGSRESASSFEGVTESMSIHWAVDCEARRRPLKKRSSIELHRNFGPQGCTYTRQEGGTRHEREGGGGGGRGICSSRIKVSKVGVNVCLIIWGVVVLVCPANAGSPL